MDREFRDSLLRNTWHFYLSDKVSFKPGAHQSQVGACLVAFVCMCMCVCPSLRALITIGMIYGVI